MEENSAKGSKIVLILLGIGGAWLLWSLLRVRVAAAEELRPGMPPEPRPLPVEEMTPRQKQSKARKFWQMGWTLDRIARQLKVSPETVTAFLQ